MTPTRKGNYKECEGCVFFIKDKSIKYPCSKSHKEVRRASGYKLERDFKECGLFNSV